MSKKFLLSSVVAASAIGLIGGYASAAAPKITPVNFGTPSIYLKQSDNGKWAVTEDRPDYDGGGVVNMTDFSFVWLTDAQADVQGYSGNAIPNDVSNDGETVVGTKDGQPAYWTRKDGKWHLLLNYDKSKYVGGTIFAVSGDGKIGVGSLNFADNIYTETAVAWDLTTGQIIDMPELPERDFGGTNQNQMRLRDISSDGRYVLGAMSFSYQEGLHFVYDMKNHTVDYVLYEDTPRGYTPKFEGVYGASDYCMSPNGTYIGGQTYAEDPSDPNNYIATPFLYSLSTGELKLFENASGNNVEVFAVDDNGVLHGGAETLYGGPLRNYMIFSGKYWYELGQIMSQIYDIDMTTLSDLSTTGTPMGVSSDGRTLTAFIDPNRGIGYALQMDEYWSDICPNVNLMGTYVVSPTPGVAMASMSEIKIAFDRRIQLAGDAKEIELLDEDGEVVRYAMGAVINSNRATVSFRRTALDPGKVYTVRVPEGIFAMESDINSTNREMTFMYAGLESAPLAPRQVVPADGSRVPYINANSYAIQMGFPAMIALTDAASAAVYSASDNALIANLNLSVNENVLILNSVAEIPLLRNVEYKVILEAGSITDISGAAVTANERIELNYTGAYERPADGPTLFFQDFNSGLGNQFLFYEGDHRTPAQTPVSWGFLDGDSYPWWIARSSEETADYAAVSHSMYRPAGQSDDWMVLPRILIPDSKTRLTFKGQSYLNSGDKINVYVIPSNRVYASLTDEIMAELKANRELVLSETLYPGASSDNLEGDWVDYEVNLGKYADQYVYIAFVNENNNCSAVFIDDIEVTHDMLFSVALGVRESVINETSADISGTIRVQSLEASYSDVNLELCDADGNVIDTFAKSGIVLDHDNDLEFEFAKPLPLTVGEYNSFIIRIKLDDEVATYEGTIADLAFETTKRVVLEEYTGQECGNCPYGIRAVDIMTERFGDSFIPVVIRSYNGDPQTPANSNYASELGLDALGAPSGTINRRYAGYPMATGENGLYMSTGDITNGNGMWLDYVTAELAERAPMDVTAEAMLPTGSRRVNITGNINYAISTDNASINLFAVLLENKVLCQQSNYMSNSSDPLLGEWGQGGVYGQSTAYYLYSHLARNVSNANLVGTPGRLPATFTAGQEESDQLSIMLPAGMTEETISAGNADVVVMVYDNIAQRVVNAVKTEVKLDTSVDSIVAEGDLSIAAAGSDITVNGNGDITVEVYDLAGRMIAAAEGHEAVTVSLNGYNGVAVVRARDSQNVATAKLVIR